MVRISRRELRVGLVGDMQPDARWRRRDDCCPSEAFACTDTCMHACINNNDYAKFPKLRSIYVDAFYWCSACTNGEILILEIYDIYTGRSIVGCF